MRQPRDRAGIEVARPIGGAQAGVVQDVAAQVVAESRDEPLVEQQAPEGRTATLFRINSKTATCPLLATDKTDKSANADPSVGSVGPSAGASPTISDDEWGEV